MDLSQIIAHCQQNDRKAQRQLYEQLAPRMFGVCRRYIREHADVEEVLLNGFFKVFNNINKYEGKGSFEGWVRRIMVNECLMFLRKREAKKNLKVVHLEREEIIPAYGAPDDGLKEADILHLLDDLPLGYKTVFNLYAIEGYSHKEIAEQLNVSVNTSKSQLLKARRMLQDLIKKSATKIA